jgi:DNA-binding response OmpR family regulator
VSENARILIVDDDPVALSAPRRLLGKAGYCVIEAATGKEGLDMVREHRPDLVLLDVVLPDLSGIEVCRQIKADPDLNGTFVVLYSGLRTESDQQAEGFETGADGFIVTPIPNGETLARIERADRTCPESWRDLEWVTV